MKKFTWLSALLTFSIFAAGCGDDETTDAETEHGELVPEIEILTMTPEFQRAHYEGALMLAEEWQELGIDVSVQPLETNTLLSRIYSSDSHDFDVYMAGWTGRVERLDPDMFIYSVFHSSTADPGGNNASGFIHSEFDKLAENQRTEMDMDARREIIFEAQEILADEVPIITTYIPNIVQAYNSDRFANIPAMAGEGLFSEWAPMMAEPLTDDGLLRVGSLQDLDSLNPMTANTAYEWRNLRLIYDKLVRIDLDGVPSPSAAESWEVLDDTTIDVTIHEGMTFHDGEPVTIEDIKFTYDYMLEWDPGYFSAFLSPIESVEIVDDLTIRFNLIEPYAPFINNTLAQIPILPQHIWAELDEDPTEYANLEPVGSGPFVFQHWRRGEELSTRTHENYQLNVSVDGYVYRIFSQNEGMFAALETGDIDISPTLLATHLNRAKELDHVQVEEVADLGWQYLGFNLREAPFDNKMFRQALAYTVDTETIVDVHLEGIAETGGSGLVISPANEFWHNPDIQRPTYDPDRARELLEEAGYTWDSDGRLRMPNN